MTSISWSPRPLSVKNIASCADDVPLIKIGRPGGGKPTHIVRTHRLNLKRIGRGNRGVAGGHIPHVHDVSSVILHLQLNYPLRWNLELLRRPGNRNRDLQHRHRPYLTEI